MSHRLKCFLLVICIAGLVYLLRTLKSDKENLKYILPWIMLDLALGLAVVCPGLLGLLCGFFGIKTPSNMLFFFAFLLLAGLVFRMTLVIARQNKEIRALTQRLALLDAAAPESAVKDGNEE